MYDLCVCVCVHACVCVYVCARGWRWKYSCTGAFLKTIFLPVAFLHQQLSFTCSDQTDPFNRKPLTMDMVEANTELKERIQQWIKEKKSKS